MRYVSEKELLELSESGWLAFSLAPAYKSSGELYLPTKKYCSVFFKRWSKMQQRVGALIEGITNYDPVVFIRESIPTHNSETVVRYVAKESLLLPPSPNEIGYFMCYDRKQDSESPAKSWKTMKPSLEMIDFSCACVAHAYNFFWSKSCLCLYPLGVDSGLEYDAVIEVFEKFFKDHDNVYVLENCK